MRGNGGRVVRSDWWGVMRVWCVRVRVRWAWQGLVRTCFRVHVQLPLVMMIDAGADGWLVATRSGSAVLSKLVGATGLVTGWCAEAHLGTCAPEQVLALRVREEVVVDAGARPPRYALYIGSVVRLRIGARWSQQQAMQGHFEANRAVNAENEVYSSEQTIFIMHLSNASKYMRCSTSIAQQMNVRRVLTRGAGAGIALGS